MVKRVGVSQEFIVISLLFMFSVSFSFGAPVEVEPESAIWFEVSKLGGGRWEYIYDVSNINILEGLYEFTIYFAAGLYDRLAVETDGVLAATWDELVWDPVDGVGVDGGYDALAELFPIGPAMTARGYSVSFDWFGRGRPGWQYYEIVDPDTFEIIDSGWTVPEAGMLLLFGLAAVLGRKRCRLSKLANRSA